MKLKRITRIGDEARGMKKLHSPTLVFSRMDSTRLPGKALLDLNGAPALGRVLARLEMSSELDGIVVCTTTRSIDDPIAEFAIASDVQLIRGDTFDVMDRAKTAATETNKTGSLASLPPSIKVLSTKFVNCLNSNFIILFYV